MGNINDSLASLSGEISVMRSSLEVAIEETDIRCKCCCEKEFLTEAGHISSCRVQRSVCLKLPNAKKAKDITGHHFGRLTAIEPTYKRADGGSVVWKCHCECGNDKEVPLCRLVKGKVRSCGCLSSPKMKDYIGKRFGRLIVIKYAGKRNEHSNENYWLCRCDCGNETTVGQTELQNGTLSCGCFQKEKVKDMLRLIDDTSITLLERSKRTRADNKSGYVGVSQEKSGKWIAYITFKKKKYWLGRFADKEDAVRARLRGEEMHDDFLKRYYSDLVKK